MITTWNAANEESTSVRRDRFRIAAVALGARAACASLIMILLAISDRHLIFPDERDYISEAREALAGLPPDWSNYSYALAWIFDITGPSTWLPRVLNVLFGALLAVIVYEVVLMLAGRGPARLAGYATAVWPSLVLWSSLVLKDSALLLALILLLWGGLQTLRGKWWGLCVCLPAGLVVEFLRPWTFVVASIAVALAVGISAWRWRRRLVVLLPGLCLVAGVGLLGVARGHGFLGERFTSVVTTVWVIDAHREAGAEGETAFVEPPKGRMDVITGIPRGIFYNLIGPFPWQTSDPMARAFLTAELVPWYAALVYAFVALPKIGIRRLMEHWSLILTFIVGCVLVLAVYSANAGSALRLRAMIVPLIIVLASVPVADLLSRRRASSGTS